MKIKTFLCGFLIVYILLSLPAMLGIGVAIDWLPEASFLQKVKVDVIAGLKEHFIVKMIISVIAGPVLSFLLFVRRKRAQR